MLQTLYILVLRSHIAAHAQRDTDYARCGGSRLAPLRALDWNPLHAALRRAANMKNDKPSRSLHGCLISTWKNREEHSSREQHESFLSVWFEQQQRSREALHPSYALFPAPRPAPPRDSLLHRGLYNFVKPGDRTP